VEKFGTPVGVAREVVCEKWAGVVVPGAAGAWAVQGVHLAVAAAILAGK
jgi:hypothetical protein